MSPVRRQPRRETSVGRGLTLVVAPHGERDANDDFAAFAAGEQASVIAHDGDLDERRWPPRGTETCPRDGAARVEMILRCHGRNPHRRAVWAEELAHRRADLDEGFFEPRRRDHTSELQSPLNLVCRLLLEKKKK